MSTSRIARTVLVALSAVVLLTLALQPLRATPSTTIVISQVYGAGGNTGAVYSNDFIELFNRGTTTVDLSGWSLQYASATGTGNLGANTGQLTELSGTLAPGQYLLVQQAGGPNGLPLPVPDLIDATPIAMAAGAGKVALVSSLTGLGCNGGSTPCSAAQLAQIVDLIGYGNANFFEGPAAVPTLSATTAAFRGDNGCEDTDHNADDFTAAAPAPRNSSSPLNPCAVFDTAPAVTSTTPANGALDVLPPANVVVAFSEPVDVAGDWFSIVCSVSGVKTASVAGGPTTFTLDPDTDFGAGETCTVTVSASQVTDQDADDPPDAMAADHVFSFAVLSADPCSLPYTPTYTIQGSGSATPFAGQTVTTRGVVVGDFEGPSPTLRGFYLQDVDGDGDVVTSDALFVFNGNNDSVALGDVVRVTGLVSEFQDQTQVSASAISACGTGSIAPVDLTLPFASADAAERFEGMLVRLPQTLTVTDTFQLGRFGQVTLSAGGRLQEPTSVAAPGAPAAVVRAANLLNRIVVDDALQNQNADPILFGRGGDPLTASNTLRAGDAAADIVGVLTYTWAGNAASGNTWRVRPIGALGGTLPVFAATNPRPSGPPARTGTLRVASFNLLNYFNTFSGCTNGVGGLADGCRGAENATEFARQWPKTIAAIQAVDADVLGVIEVENDGYGPDSALQDLVTRLNASSEPGTWAFVDADAATGQVNALGTDGIKVGILYRASRVAPIGSTAVLNTTSFVTGGDSGPRNRPALAQAFAQPEGAAFVFVVNHLKSKGSACDVADAGDGQGNCNLVRTNAALELAAWLAGDPTGTGDPDVLIAGDLNAYAKEDPIAALEHAAYVNLVPAFSGLAGYSYTFGGQWGALDHALASPNLVGQITNVAEVHINAAEPTVLDYNTNFKSVGQLTSLYAPDEFRAADHDPVAVDLHLVNLIVGTDRGERIFGTEGPDRIIGGGGPDQLTGLGGRDLFTFLAMNDGPDAIMDFKVGEDVIDLFALLRDLGFTGGDALAAGWVRVVGTPTKPGRGRIGIVQIDTNGPAIGGGYQALVLVPGASVEQLARATNFIY